VGANGLRAKALLEVRGTPESERLTHTRKILSQAGTSLADSYDVEGSIVGVESLDASDVKLVHEMGGTMVSERMNSLIIQGSSTAVLQTVTWDVSLGQPPDVFNRILGVFVTADVNARVSFCSLALADVVTGEEIPYWSWDTLTDSVRNVRWQNQGAAVSNVIQLVPEFPIDVPNLMTRIGASKQMQQTVFRGLSATFGAGNVTVLANILLARPSQPVPSPGEPKSHGLPLPGW